MTRRLSTWVEAQLEQRLAEGIDFRVGAGLACGLEETDRRLAALTEAAANREVLACEVARRLEAGPADRLRRDHELSMDVLLGAGRANDRTLNPERYQDLVAEIRMLTGVEDVALPPRAYQTLLEPEARGSAGLPGRRTTSSASWSCHRSCSRHPPPCWRSGPCSRSSPPPWCARSSGRATSGR